MQFYVYSQAHIKAYQSVSPYGDTAYSQEHLKTMVYAKFGGANKVYYGEFENREYKMYPYGAQEWNVNWINKTGGEK